MTTIKRADTSPVTATFTLKMGRHVFKVRSALFAKQGGAISVTVGTKRLWLTSVVESLRYHRGSAYAGGRHSHRSAWIVRIDIMFEEHTERYTPLTTVVGGSLDIELAPLTPVSLPSSAS